MISCILKEKKSVYEKVFSDLVDTPILKNELGDSAGVFGLALTINYSGQPSIFEMK